jgi:signal transduction histidine kinase
VLTQPLPQVFADHDRTRQILVSLVTNGIQCTSKGGVAVNLSVAKGMVQVAVVDTGRGIPAASQHLLFRKFQQASSSILTRESSNSAGLGLYISKLLAEGMSGHLYLKETKVHKGSTFVLELPPVQAVKS